VFIMNGAVDKSKSVGIILGYRRSKANQYTNQVLIKVLESPSGIAGFIGASVVARDVHGNVYRGKVIRVHSRKKSVVVVRFRRNIPGQLIRSFVEIKKR